MGIKTNSALATLDVSKTVYDQDLLLKWICQIASPLQLTINVDKKSPFKLEAQNVVLTCRNAILRAICGTVLHGALDQYPYYLLGGFGYSDSIKVAQVVQWMSVADNLRQGNASSGELLSDLDKHLETKALLIGSSQPSLSDYDMALVLDKNVLNDSAFPAAQRWYAAVMWSFKLYAKDGLTMPVSVSPPAIGPITFYYGLEDTATVLKPLDAPKSKPAGGTATSEKKGNKQGGEQGQKGDAAQEKKAKKQNTAGGGGSNESTPDSFNIFALDIRVGKIVKAWHHEEADKLFCEDVDLGSETRQIASGLRQFYKTDDLVGRLVLVLCNLKKRNLVGFPSHGMVLCASNSDHSKVEFVVPAEGSKPGDRVFFEGCQGGEPEPENKITKKKIFESLAPDLKTDENGFVVWKNAKAKTEAGNVKALNGMPNAQVA
ncbi:hypothetical protein ACA910_005115 [Epithemia clementina (nom. ined.)]